MPGNTSERKSSSCLIIGEYDFTWVDRTGRSRRCRRAKVGARGPVGVVRGITSSGSRVMSVQVIQRFCRSHAQ